jgi:hypothetical protein
MFEKTSFFDAKDETENPSFRAAAKNSRFSAFSAHTKVARFFFVQYTKKEK